MGKLVIKNSKARSSSLERSLRSMIAKKEQESRYTLLLCDVSGSMDEIARGERKIDTLARTVNRLVKEENCKLIAFSKTARNVARLQAIAGGSTNMTAALRLACSHRDAKKVVIISDGYPDNPDTALATAKAVPCPISCIYIGPGEDKGYDFLCQLARIGRGKATFTGEDTQAIEKSIRLMLPQ